VTRSSGGRRLELEKAPRAFTPRAADSPIENLDKLDKTRGRERRAEAGINGAAHLLLALEEKTPYN